MAMWAACAALGIDRGAGDHVMIRQEPALRIDEEPGAVAGAGADDDHRRPDERIKRFSFGSPERAFEPGPKSVLVQDGLRDLRQVFDRHRPLGELERALLGQREFLVCGPAAAGKQAPTNESQNE